MIKINKESKAIKKAKTTHRRRLKGVVVSDKTKDMVVVAVDQTKINTKYQKRYKFTKKYHAHDAGNNCKNGDLVIIEESRPISKTKKWRVISVENKK